MKRLALITLLAACATQADDYPLLPSGGGSSPGGAGAPPFSTSPGTVSGRVCIVSDPRDLGGCTAGDASGMSVTGNGMTATTTGDGRFALPIVADGGLPSVISIVGPGMVPTQMPLSPSSSAPMSIPLLKADLFNQMMAANGITLASGSGSILGTVVRGGMPVAGVTVASTPSPAFGPLFDGSTPTSWTLDGTGARGVIWIPGVASGPTQLTFRDLATSGETTVNGVQVINGGITIMDAVLP